MHELLGEAIFSCLLIKRT